METSGPPEVPGLELGTLLGRGGSGEVWEGVDLEGGRRVAVKVSAADPAAVEAAVREAAVTARTAAEHVLAVEACLPLADGRVALVMPLMRGGSLAGLIAARGHLGPGEVVTVLAPLAGALGRLHAAGVVHGDVSPGNVLLDLDGRPVLADLGVGRVLGEAPQAVWGTPGHIAPEVLLGGEPSPASDVYALGALGWLCLAGEVPGAPGLRPTLPEVCRAGAGSEPLVAAVEAAVSPRVADRPDADELAGLLFAAAEPEPLRLVAGDDAVSAVTYRLRAAAGRPPVPDRPPPRRGRHRGAPRAARRRERRLPVLRLGQVLRAAAGGVAALVVAAAVLGVLGTQGLRDDPARAAVRPEVSTTPREPGPGPTAPTAPSAPAREPGPATDVRTDPEAARRRPAELLTALAGARAEAYRLADPTRLAEAESDDGALRARDEAAVGALRSSGVRYPDLRYEVDAVAVRGAGSRTAVLSARLGVAGYRVVGGDTTASRPAVRPAPVLVDLVLTGRGWRLADVRPVR
ncbi:protein kinase [Phycicoccus sp.]|uniref:serine/threonine-protein kinase n=1 Tax=Phycicoccus sp. TaxID=1902410 RepID=UPI002B673E1E|nr:protein kinase [Phycicoccus sp.]HMM95841.1 protein kinase [Phycicoccus sp.]